MSVLHTLAAGYTLDGTPEEDRALRAEAVEAARGGRTVVCLLGLPESYFSMERLEFHGRVSFLKGGLVHASASPKSGDACPSAVVSSG